MKDGFTEVYRIKRDDGDDVVIGCNKEPGEARRLIIDGADTERVFEGVATMASFCYGRGFVGDDDVNDMRWRLSGRCLGLFAASEEGCKGIRPRSETAPARLQRDRVPRSH